MRSLSFALLLATLAPAVARAEVPANTLTDAEKRSGWELLFNGKSADGWRNYKKPGLGDGWKVVDGTLSRAGNGEERHHRGERHSTRGRLAAADLRCRPAVTATGSG